MNRRSFIRTLGLAPVAAVVPVAVVASAKPDGIVNLLESSFDGLTEAQMDRTVAVLRARAYRIVPPPSVRLWLAGQRTYQEWCEALLKAGRLTLETRDAVESLAISADVIGAGKCVPAWAMKQRRDALARLEALTA